MHCSSSSFDRQMCKCFPFSKQNLLTDLGLSCREIFLLAISSPRSLFFFELLQDPLCTQHLSRSCLEKWLRGKYEFPASSSPEKCSVEGGGGGQGQKKKNSHGGKGIWGKGQKINVRMDPSLSFLGSSVSDLKCFCRKTKIENWLQLSIFNF